MAGIRGRRKAVVFFSEGIDYDIYDPIANTYASDILQYSKDAIAAATRANVSFYGVDPRGLAGFDDAAEIGSIPNDPSLGLGLAALQRELQISQDSLRTSPTRPAGSQPSIRTISPGASNGSSRTTAATTSSATTRTTPSATGSSANWTFA